jgi:hypothetical protein
LRAKEIPCGSAAAGSGCALARTTYRPTASIAAVAPRRASSSGAASIGRDSCASAGSPPPRDFSSTFRARSAGIAAAGASVVGVGVGADDDDAPPRRDETRGDGDGDGDAVAVPGRVRGGVGVREPRPFRDR